MTANQWMLIGLLATAAYAIRLIGLLGGQAVNASPRLKPVLDDLPGCLVVGLVGASLAGEPLLTWVAAMAALGVAIVSNNLVVTMVVGFAVIFGLEQI